MEVESFEDRLALSPVGCHGRDVQFDLQGNTFNVTAQVDRVVIKCDSFDLASNETVNFNLPSTSAVLTRVTGGSASQILGHLNSNGQVFLSNPAGIFFAPGSTVRAGSFFATTMKISSRDFKAGGDLSFRREGNVSPGAIVNEGDIEVQPQGYLVLAAAAIENQWFLVAPYGSVYLTVGDRVTAHMMDNYILSRVTVDQRLDNRVASEDLAIDNRGLIVAHGGLVRLEAELTSGLYQHAINSSVFIDASGYGSPDGEIDIVAHSDAHDADFHPGGTIDAGANGTLNIDVDGIY